VVHRHVLGDAPGGPADDDAELDLEIGSPSAMTAFANFENSSGRSGTSRPAPSVT
jgi:hypothetical protein